MHYFIERLLDSASTAVRSFISMLGRCRESISNVYQKVLYQAFFMRHFWDNLVLLSIHKLVK